MTPETVSIPIECPYCGLRSIIRGIKTDDEQEAKKVLRELVKDLPEGLNNDLADDDLQDPLKCPKCAVTHTLQKWFDASGHDYKNA